MSSEDSRNQRARELVSKLKQKPAAASETSKVEIIRFRAAGY